MNQKEIHAIATKLSAELADKGQIIEGGWKAFELLSLQHTSPLQRSEMRKSFFFGAQHLFASLMSILDPGEDATERDLKRMDAIKAELDRFLASVKTNPTSN